MVIEDDECYLGQMKFALNDRNYDVITTLNPQEGIAQLKTFNPDVLLVDWVMPIISGLDVIKKIRGELNNDSLYIIMISGKIMTDDIVTALTAGANDYMIKPFSEDELIARISNGVRNKQIQTTNTYNKKILLDDLNKLDAAFNQLEMLLHGDTQTTRVFNEASFLLTKVRAMLMQESKEE